MPGMSYHVENPCCPCCEEQEQYRSQLLSALAVLRDDKRHIAEVVCAEIRKVLRLPELAPTKVYAGHD